MKLLFDQNLSSTLVQRLADLFPDALHIRDLGLEQADDAAVWKTALERDLVIVTKDQDFNDRAALAEKSPKIIWIRLGNCPTIHIEQLIRWRIGQILEFGGGPDSVLAIP